MTNTRKTYLNDCVYNGHVRKWNKDTLLIFIASCEDPQYSKMVKTAYQLWLAETNHTLKVEYVEDLYESDINISFFRFDIDNFGSCEFSYDNKGQFIGAEISIPMLDLENYPQYDMQNIFQTTLKLVGHSLGLPNSPYKEDITFKDYQYTKVVGLTDRDRLSMKWLYRIKSEISVANLVEMVGLDKNTSLDDFIAFFEKGANYAKENAEENDEKKEAQKSAFDIDDFVSSMTSQAKDLVPSDVSQETSDYIISKMDSFLRMAYEAISNDNELNPTNDDYILLLQILAEWIFHKSVDISRSKIPTELWDNIMQRIAFCIFEIVKQSWKREISKDVIVDAVARHVDKCYKEGLQQLLDNKKITKEIFEAAIAESNIDKMADEIEKESNIKNALGYDSVDEMISAQANEKIEEIKKKNQEQLKTEQKRIKEAIKNDKKLDDDVTLINDAMEVAEKYFEQEKKVNDEQKKLKKIRKEYEKKTNKAIDYMIPENMKKTMQKQEESKFGKLFSKHVLGNSVEIFLGSLVICLNSKINLSILSFVGVLLFLYNHFSTSIAEFIIKCNFSLPTVNFIVYFVSILIIGKIIVSSIMKAQEESEFWKLFPLKHVLGYSVEIFLGALVICLNSKINLSILSFVGVLLFLYNHFSTSIAEFIIKCNFSLPIVNFIVYFVSILIIGKIIVSSIMKAFEDDTQKVIKMLEDDRQNRQDLVNPDKRFEKLGVDILRLEIGAGLLCIADPDQDGKLLANISALRVELRDKLGYIIPNIRICDSSELENFEYQISVRDEVVASGYVYPNKYMVLADEWDSKVGKVPENIIYGVDPALDTQCYWLDKEDVENHWDNITVVVGPGGVIKTHLETIVIKYVDSIITSCDIEKYIEIAKKAKGSEQLIANLNERLNYETIRKVFVNLIRENVSIKDIIYVFDKLSEFSKYTTNPNILSERLRATFGLNICLKHSEDKVLYALNLSAEWEEMLDSILQRTEIGTMFLITPRQFQELVETTAMSLMMAHQEIGFQPVIVCRPNIRLPLYELLVRHIPSIVVMSYSELVQEIKVELINEIKWNPETIENNDIEEIQDNEEFYEQEPLLGRVIDSDGKPLDGGIENYSLEEMFSEIAPVDSSEPAPITKIFKTGVRAVDAFITIGYGQKMGVFAPSGCGLSTFLGLILKNSEADINIVSLVVDSVEIAWDFINYCVKYEPNIQRKTIVICSTPLDSAEKIKKNFETAVSLCEYYRDKGKNVLFINDKTEPILNAVEKIAWENGEPACENDYRLAVTSWYQRLINHCKSNDNGTITTILTTNITPLDKGNAAVNTIRKSAQGHIFLSRKVAEQNIYPAIDVLGSISRSHIDLASNEHKMAASTVRKILSLYREGSKDEFVLKKYNEVVSFIQQRVADNPSLEETLQGLVQLTSNIKFKK